MSNSKRDIDILEYQRETGTVEGGESGKYVIRKQLNDVGMFGLAPERTWVHGSSV